MIHKNLIFLFSFFVFHFSPALDSKISLDTLLNSRIIIQDHADLFDKVSVQDATDRIKPFHTVSSELLRKISRKETFYNQTSTQIILGMIVDPLLWQIIPIIKVSDPQVLSILTQEGPYVSFVSFFSNNNYVLTPYVDAAYSKKPINRTKFDKQIIDVDERVNICSLIFSDQLIKLFPSKTSTADFWQSDVAMNVPGVDTSKTASFKAVYRDVIYTAFADGDWGSAHSMINFINNYQQDHAESILPSNRKVNLEILYNKLKPFGWTRLFMCYLLIGLFMLSVLLIDIFYSNKSISRVILLIKYTIFGAFCFHLSALALRWYISGHAPWSNAYESVIFIAFATMLAGIVFSKKSNFTLVASSLVASMLLFVANLNWLNPEITNLVPVLKSYWLMIHVSVITSSYGFFGLCAFLGLLNLLLIGFSNQSQIKSNVSTLTVINEQSMMIGLFLLTIGTFLGGVWANESWGRYWGWDPKETWALVSCLVYALILHIRLLKSKKYIYWFNLCSLFGFSSILMTYFGVNFYLDGLHSYAAGDPFPIPSFVLPTYIGLGLISVFSFFKFNNWIRV
tara:strand:- start:3219 stop:4919 length:1701 start_codon:yes stop_codon:yes gene_type:complete